MRRIGGFKLCLNQKSLSQKHLPPPLKLSLLNFLFLKKNLYLLLFTVLFLFFFTRCNPASIINDEAQQLTELIQNSNPEATYTVRVDRTTPDTPFIVIDGLTNSASGEPLAVSVPIKQEAGVLTTDPESIPITANSLISPHTETQEIKATFGDSAEPLPFTVEIRIGGALIQEWLTADTLSDYISASFASQAATLSLSVSDNTISVDGLTNAENGVEGSFDFSSLPSGFTVDPKTITLPDPDGPKISATTITPSSSTFTITDTVNSKNTQPYTINTIALAELSDEAQQVAELIKNSNPDATYTVRVDRTTPDTPFIVIDGLTNSASGEPLAVSVPIKQEAGVLTTDLESISITANSLISPYSDTREIKATFGDSAEPLPFTVEIRIGGALIQEWLTADTFSNYISASFASQAASLSLRVSDNTISVDDLTNAENGVEGSFNFSSLPSGFTVDPETITLPDPDGSDIIAATITPSSPTFIITDTVNSTNEQRYTIDTIALAELSVFTPGIHISVSDGSSDITPTLAISVDENNSNLITITNLTNTVGEQKIYTLTISPPDSGIFSTPNDSPITITITEPDGFSPDDATLSSTDFTVTNRGDTTGTTYTLTVPVSGAPIQEWLTADTFSNYFTGATFAGQAANLSFNFDEDSDEYIIAIDGSPHLNNVPGAVLQLTTRDIPSGYLLTQNLRVLDGSGLDAITNGNAGSITIAEEGNTTANTQTYSVNISLAAYVSPIQLSHVLATDFDGATIDSSNIQINTNVITISGIANTVGTNGFGSVTITAPSGYSIDPATSLNFDNPQGSDVQTVTLDQTVDITDTTSGLIVTHTVKLRFDAVLALTINSSHIMNSPVIFESEGTGTVTITGLERCEVLPPPTITITGAPTGSRAIGFPTYFNRESDTLSGSSYSVDRMLSILDDNNNEIASVSITVTGFHTCNASHLSGSGDDADNALEIDTAPKLELLSHLVNSDNANYGDKYYKLTADIDLDLAGLPWSQTAGGEGFPPIGINDGTSFKGTFDCDGNTIFNLYINRPSNDNIGFFGYASNNAAIQNCNLIGVNVLGTDYVGGLAGYLSSSSITNSYASGSVSGTNYVGGLAGYLSSSSITNSYTTGSVSGTSNVGGLAGYLDSSSSITNSYVSGSVSGTSFLGGLVGRLNSFSSITTSYVTGNVSGTGNSVGGLVGRLNSSSSITTSYATGNVSGIGNVGGLVGYLSSSSITNSYATGNVSGTGNGVEGLAGYLDSSSSITNSYWDTTTSGQANSAGGTGKTTTELQSASAPTNDIYTGWDTDIWKFDPTTQYPRLKTVACANRQYEIDQSIACGPLPPDPAVTLTIDSPNIVSGPVSLESGVTVTITGLENCEVLPPPTITISGAPTGSRTIGFPAYFNRKSDTLLSGSYYRVDRLLSILDGNDNEIGSFFITVTGFPTCNAFHASLLSGSGDDAANAYEIDTAPKLELLSHLVNSDNDNYGSKFYKLTADIDLGLASLPWSQTASGKTGEGFPPIGIDYVNNFQGTFDCDGNTIFNLYIKRQSDNAGLFGELRSNATIQNCNFIGVNVSGTTNVGGLVGTLFTSSITNSYVTGSVSGTTNVGGLAGYLYTSSSITNSYVTGSVSGTTNVGGLAGEVIFSSSSITNSYATGSVSGTTDVGGLVGDLSNSSSISNSYATGSVSGGGRVGGLVGNLSSSSSITNSYWDTVTSGRTDSAGGTGKTTTDLQSASAPTSDIYTGWDTDIWKFDPDTQYPRLKTVACANRQYETDPSNVLTDCRALQ